MDDPPSYTPSSLYTWTQTNYSRKKLALNAAGHNLLAGSVGLTIGQTTSALFLPGGAGLPGWYIAGGLALLGGLMLLIAYWLPRWRRLARANGRLPFGPWYKPNHTKRANGPTWSKRYCFATPQGEAPCLDMVIRRPDCILLEPVKIPLSGAYWVGGASQKPWATFPTAHYAAGDNGKVTGYYGQKVLIMSPANNFGLQPWTQLAEADPAADARRMLEGL